jgi:hypothetical protein
MTQNVISPFAGKPRTWQTTDANGLPVFHVEPRILTPLRASTRNFLSGVGSLGLIGYSLLSVAGADNADGGMLLTGLAFAAGGCVLLHKALDTLLRKKVRIMMTLDRFSVRKLFGWKHYDRLLPHRFAVLPHDWLQAERDQEEYRMQQAQLKRQAMKKSKLYAESFHISFDYLGQRNDLMTVYGQKETLAVAMRLKACDDVLDAMARKGHGTPLSPQEEWHDQPGEIPETV